MKNHFHHGMRSIPLVLALGASAAGCATDDLDDADLGTQQNQIIGGGNVSEQTRHDMGLVDVASAKGNCSGSLFDTSWVITATHCIDFDTISGNTFGVPRAPPRAASRRVARAAPSAWTRAT